MPETEYLTVPEVADRFRVSPMTVHRWIRAGVLTAVKVGKVTRIPTESVERLQQRAG